MKKTLKISILFFVGLTVVALFYASHQSKAQKKFAGGFTRSAAQEKLIRLHQRNFEKKSVFHKILGKNEDHLYYLLADDATYEVWEFSCSNFQAKKLLEIDGDAKNQFVHFSSQQMSILSPLVETVFTYQLPEGRLLNKTSINETYLRAAFLDEKTLVAKGENNGKNFLKVVDIQNPTARLASTYQLFKNSPDGGLLTEDGQILYDGKNIYYVCFYVNTFYCLDKNLNLVYQANTIDTVRTFPKIIEKKIGSSSAYKFAEPVTQSCAVACVSPTKLYIHSLIPANNDVDKFARYHIIDQYETTQGKYEKSYYLEKQEEKLVDFRVFDRQIVVLYPSGFALYELQ